MLDIDPWEGILDPNDLDLEKAIENGEMSQVEWLAEEIIYLFTESLRNPKNPHFNETLEIARRLKPYFLKLISPDQYQSSTLAQISLDFLRSEFNAIVHELASIIPEE